MRRASRIVVSLLGLVAPGAAAAADPIAIATSNSAAGLPLHDEAGFDWTGFYAGVYGGAQSGSAADTQAALGLQLGVNAQFGFYLLGAEVAVHGLPGAGGRETSYGEILGRAGLVLENDMAIYAAGGYGIDLGTADQENLLLGGGVEVPVNESVSLEAQYLHGFPIGGGTATDQFTIGANFHF